MSMVLTQERFHADPHPGNLFAMSGDRLGIVDFGEVGSISPATRTTISAMLIGIASRDADTLARRHAVGNQDPPLDKPS